MLPELGGAGEGAATINTHVLEESFVAPGNALYKVQLAAGTDVNRIMCCRQRKILEENNPNIITSDSSITQTFCKEHKLVL